MSTPRLNPPFRAEHLGACVDAARSRFAYRVRCVGSLKRPAELLAKRAAFDKGEVSAEELRVEEDKAIAAVIALQRETGIKVRPHRTARAGRSILTARAQSITDGEFRRCVRVTSCGTVWC